MGLKLILCMQWFQFICAVMGIGMYANSKESGLSKFIISFSWATIIAISLAMYYNGY